MGVELSRRLFYLFIFGRGGRGLAVVFFFRSGFSLIGPFDKMLTNKS